MIIYPNYFRMKELLAMNNMMFSNGFLNMVIIGPKLSIGAMP